MNVCEDPAASTRSAERLWTASNVRAIRDATVIRTRCVSATAISAKTLVAASTQLAGFTKTSRNATARRIIHRVIRCTHVRIFLSVTNVTSRSEYKNGDELRDITKIN